MQLHLFLPDVMPGVHLEEPLSCQVSSMAESSARDRRLIPRSVNISYLLTPVHFPTFRNTCCTWPILNSHFLHLVYPQLKPFRLLWILGLAQISLLRAQRGIQLQTLAKIITIKVSQCETSKRELVWE